MASNREKPNGSGHAPAANGMMPSFDHEHIRGRQTFDLDRSRLSMSPTLFWSIVAGSVGMALFIGSQVWDANNRIANVETGITDLRDEIRSERDNTQTKQQALVDCLLQERVNKGWTCPQAPQARAPDQPKREKRKVAATPKGPTNPWAWFAPALAGGGK